MIKALLFDLDGTLVDSQEDIYASQLFALKDIGMENITLSSLYPLKGYNLKNVLAKLKQKELHEISENESALFSERYRFYYTNKMFEHTKPFPEVIETLNKFKNIKKAVTTSKVFEYALMLINRFDMKKYFEIIQGSENLPTKPDPAILIKASDYLKVETSNCLVVGDTEQDILAGKKAGSLTCLVNYTKEKPSFNSCKADYIIEKFSSLEEILRENNY